MSHGWRTSNSEYGKCYHDGTYSQYCNIIPSTPIKPPTTAQIPITVQPPVNTQQPITVQMPGYMSPTVSSKLKSAGNTVPRQSIRTNIPCSANISSLMVPPVSYTVTRPST